MTTTVFDVPEISCETCKSALETALSPAAGVRSVLVDVAGTTVTVRHEDPASATSLAALIEGQGYDVHATRSGASPAGGDKV